MSGRNSLDSGLKVIESVFGRNEFRHVNKITRALLAYALPILPICRRCQVCGFTVAEFQASGGKQILNKVVRCRFSYGVRTGITVNNKNFIGRAFQKIESRFGERVQIVAVIFNLETGFEEFGFILKVTNRIALFAYFLGVFGDTLVDSREQRHKAVRIRHTIQEGDNFVKILDCRRGVLAEKVVNCRSVSGCGRLRV